MDKYLACLVFNLIGLFIPDIAFCQNNITVTISGLHSSNGKVMAELFNSENGYPQDHTKAFRELIKVITNNTCTIVFSDIPKGTYAIACFHDENDNGKLDANFMGIPKEGVGASNNAKGFMGPPKFKDAKFVVEKDVVMSIAVTY